MTNNVNILWQQVIALFQQGDIIRAQDCAVILLKLSPKHLGALQILGGIKVQLGDYSAASDLFSSAIKINPSLPTNYNNLGYVLHIMGDLENAHRACRKAIQINPDFSAAYNTLAVVLKDMGDLKGALTEVKKAIQITPDFIEAQNTLIIIYSEIGLFNEAMTACRHVLQKFPSSDSIYNLQAMVLDQLGMFDEALISCNRAIELQPSRALYYDTLGNILNKQGLMQDSIDAYNKSIEMDSENSMSYYNRGTALDNLGRFKEAEFDYRRAIKLNPDNVEAHSNLLFVNAAEARISNDEMFEEQKKWDEVHGKQGRLNSLHSNLFDKIKKNKIRIGYVSADFRMHPVSYFFEPLLMGRNKNKFEIFCYANMYESQNDQVTYRLKKLFDHWRYVKNNTDIELATQIKHDEIDILIDLSGHTRNNRLKMFTYRPAAIQVMYLGYSASSGLEAMDYWITDNVLHPENTIEKSSETIIRLPRCSFCYKPPPESYIEPFRAENSGGIVFASYSHLSKISPEVVAVWSKILKAVNGSRLMIVDKYMADTRTRDLFVDQFIHNDISENRLIIKQHLSYTDYYKSYSNIDIVLDSFPRTGGTTTADALWMGVPVVTLSGEHYIERISASKLHALGLDEFISNNQGNYIEKAINLAKDKRMLKSLRKNLREQFIKSDLYDSKGLSKAMEDIYKKIM